LARSRLIWLVAVFRFCRLKGIGLDVIQAPKAGPRIMRYELADLQWAAIRSFHPNKPRGFPRVDDRRVLNGCSGNCLADRGIADPDEFRVKSHLCHEIATIVDPH
jgi:hypothetical protein